jgi:hypothetical protein
MAKLNIKVGANEVGLEGTKSFLRTHLPELVEIVTRPGLATENLQARDDALALVGGLQADLQILETHHQNLSDLFEKASLVVRNRDEELESFFRTIHSSALTAFGAGAGSLPGIDQSGAGGGLGVGGAGVGGGPGVGGAAGGVGAAAGGDSQTQLLAATKQMQETQMSFNLQYLQLQSQMQHENRSYTAVSNIMKTKHDTVKNSISNIR